MISMCTPIDIVHVSANTIGVHKIAFTLYLVIAYRVHYCTCSILCIVESSILSSLGKRKINYVRFDKL